MLSRAANWMIAAGALAMFVGICLVPAAMGQHEDTGVLALGASVFSFGALLIGTGMYSKARALQAAAASIPEPKSRRVHGGCELCGSETPVILCKVHQLHLCPACLAAHYDFRSCVYAPSTRRVGGKQKSAAKARSASLT